MTDRDALAGLCMLGGICISVVLGFVWIGAPLEFAFWGIAAILVVIGLLALPYFPATRGIPLLGRRTAAQEEGQGAQDRLFSECRAAGFRARSTFLRGVVVAGNHAGVAFEHYVIPGGKRTPARVAVSISTSAPGEFNVSPEGSGSALAKTLGLGDEFQTGDDALDRNYYFSGTSDEYVASVFGDRENLRHLRELLALDYTELDKDAGKLTATGVDNQILPLSELKDVVEKLAAFRLPTTVAGEDDRRLTPARMMHVVRAAAFVVVIAAMYGFSATAILVDGSLVFFGHQLPLVAALFIAALAAMYFTAKGRSLTPAQFRELAVYAMLLVPAILGALMLANEDLDRSEASVHEVQLLRNYQVRGSKGGTSYYLVFTSWRDRSSEELRVGYDTYGQAAGSKQRSWELRIRDGWLHESWVESMQLATHTPDTRKAP